MRARALELAVIAVVCASTIVSGGCGGGGTSNSDGAATVDMASSGPQVTVNWRLLTALLQGGTNNGFAASCGDGAAGNVQSLSFTIVGGGGSKSRSSACSAGMSFGTVVLDAPDGNGHFTVTGKADGQPMSNSEVIKDVAVAQTVSLNIYVQGCDQMACMP